jgi:hypothetical protein
MQSEEIITQYFFIKPLRESVYFLFSVTLVTEKGLHKLGFPHKF